MWLTVLLMMFTCTVMAASCEGEYLHKLFSQLLGYGHGK